jgi:hypothetical protein
MPAIIVNILTGAARLQQGGEEITNTVDCKIIAAAVSQANGFNIQLRPPGSMNVGRPGYPRHIHPDPIPAGFGWNSKAYALCTKHYLSGEPIPVFIEGGPDAA